MAMGSSLISWLVCSFILIGDGNNSCGGPRTRVGVELAGYS